MSEELFFELLRISLGNQDSFSSTPSESEWNEIYSLAQKHSVIGICFAGIRHIHAKSDSSTLFDGELVNLKMPGYMGWLARAAVIQSYSNMLLDQCDKVRNIMDKGGMNSVILKGQGVAQYYGDKSVLRQNGDIDIWIWPKGNWKLKRNIRMTLALKYLRSLYRCGRPTYHNVSVRMFKKTHVEVHYTPSWLYSPVHNHRMQKWFEKSAPEEMKNKFSSLEFNLVYILAHIYRHLLSEGVGLRQVVDYYHVLKTANGDKVMLQKTMQLLDKFGLLQFTGGLMYIMRDILGMEEKYLLCEPDVKEGRFILKEIMLSGNFGYYDKRIDHSREKGPLGTFVMHVTRNLRFLFHYPNEVLWCPLWKIWHQLWIKKYRG